jgi:enoyl-CoA hydratase/carnithine racemase
LTVSSEADGNVAVVTIDDGRANLIGSAALEQLLRELGQAAEADAVILAGRRSIFSAGLDLPEINACDDDGRLAFFELLHDVRVALYGLPRPLVSLVRGSAVGAGASFVCCADVRLGALDSGQIGFTEGRLGFPLPASARVIAQSVLTTPAGQLGLLHGSTFDRQEAAELGYFHQLVETDAADDVARSEAAKLADVSASAAMIKGSLRAAGLAEMERDRAVSHRLMVDTWATAMHRPAMVELAAKMQRIKSRAR